VSSVLKTHVYSKIPLIWHVYCGNHDNLVLESTESFAFLPGQSFVNEGGRFQEYVQKGFQ
jgi:hypothetical protein